MSATYQQAVNLIQTSWRTQKVPNVCNIPTSWYRVSHSHHSELSWYPVSATYQQVDIKGHTDITAHLDGVQCLQVDIERHTDIIAYLDGAQCLQHTNKLISSVTQTSSRT